MRVLVTGGAGFVGGNVCVSLATLRPDWQVVALDNLRRRGSELNVRRLREAGVEFVHGDVRELDDVLAVGEVDAVIEASAEPSVLAGLSSGLDYLVRTNLVGAYHCLELCRRHEAQLVFLSTSRVYPTAALGGVAYREEETRFELEPVQDALGVTETGVTEAFTLNGARTPYGATKLAAEILVTEYAETFSLTTTVNRCGVIAGPWQMGKVDQGVVAHWVLAHRLGRPLRYLGYGGSGKQVRDLLHVDDLVDLLVEQLDDPAHWRGEVLNVGGGRPCSLSLLELTELCRELTGATVEIEPDPAPRPGDMPIYLSDCTALFAHTAWRPTRQPREIVQDILIWVDNHRHALERALD